MPEKLNRRKYLRIATVLPVEFFIVDNQDKRITPWLQGFTCNIGRGGICLTVNDLWWGFWDKIKVKDNRLFLQIEFFLWKEPVYTKARVVWFKEEKSSSFCRYVLGIEFLEINSKKTALLFGYALSKRVIPYAVGGVIIGLALSLFSLFWQNYAVVRENRRLVGDYVNILEKTALLEELLKQDKVDIENIPKMEEQVMLLQRERSEVSYKIIQGMYNWVKNRQDLISGLVLSFEGDNNLEKVSFTYDQALAVFVFLIEGDDERAEKILDFYLEKIQKEDIYNAYFSRGNVFEYTIHSGPNAWIGLAALDYTKRTGNRKYLPIAVKVGDFLLEMMDKEGGVGGGPGVSWYSTEHNLDAFAFFKLLYQVTGEDRYEKAATKVKKWLAKYAYTSYGPPVKRGKGDSTIATDTYTWSITALGPELLYSLGMNPESILQFAVEHCETKTKFIYKTREAVLRGFDFAKVKHEPRGGIVSGEWTSQMILAFEVMADYFKQKDSKKHKEYLEKANFYFDELQKMLITSPSRVGREDPCLPYASDSFIDTGHGWKTPKGIATGSLASTAYFLIAYHGYNPLKGEFLQVSLKPHNHQSHKDIKGEIENAR